MPKTFIDPPTPEGSFEPQDPPIPARRGVLGFVGAALRSLGMAVWGLLNPRWRAQMALRRAARDAVAEAWACEGRHRQLRTVARETAQRLQRAHWVNLDALPTWRDVITHLESVGRLNQEVRQAAFAARNCDDPAQARAHAAVAEQHRAQVEALAPVVMRALEDAEQHAHHARRSKEIEAKRGSGPHRRRLYRQDD